MKTIIILQLLLLSFLCRSYRRHFKNLKLERHTIDIIQRLSAADAKLNRSIKKHLNLLKLRKKKNEINFNNCVLQLLDSQVRNNQCVVNYEISQDFDNNKETCDEVIKLIDQQEQQSVKMGIFLTKFQNLNGKQFSISVDDQKHFSANVEASPIDCPDFFQFIKQSYNFKYKFIFKKEDQKDVLQTSNSDKTEPEYKKDDSKIAI